MRTKTLYIELGQSLPALLYLNNGESMPQGYRLATEEEFEIYKDKLNRIYLATGNAEDPSNIDYDLLGLFKKRVIVDGELINVRYYNSYDPMTDTYSGLAVEELRTYVRNTEGYVMYRLMTINWYTDDSDIGCSKTTMKYYTMVQSMEEGISKRSNILAQLKADLLIELIKVNGYTMVEAELEAKPLLNEQAMNMGIYKEGDRQPLLIGIGESSVPLLDYTIYGQTYTFRHWILDTLS